VAENIFNTTDLKSNTFFPAYTIFCAILIIRASKSIDHYSKLISEFSAQIVYFEING